MSGTLPPEGKATWTDKVGTLVHAYNSTKSAITGFSPHYLMFGREPKLPLDVTFGLPNPDMEAVIHERYVKQFQSRLKWSYRVAQCRNQKEAARQKKYYDLKVRCAPLKVGDLVVPRQKSFRGKCKIQDRWDSTLYEVIEIPYPDTPVFKIQPQGIQKQNQEFCTEISCSQSDRSRLVKQRIQRHPCSKIKKTWMTAISKIFPSRKVMRNLVKCTKRSCDQK